MTIGEKLKKCRANTAFTQADIAEKLHLSRKTISGWETGRNYPDIGSLIKLSEIYKVSLEDLVRDERMLEHFDEQKKSRGRESSILKISYWINVVFLMLEIIEVMRINGFHFTLIPLILTINLIVFLSHFDGWNRFKSTFYVVKVLLVLTAVFIVASVVSVLNPDVVSALAIQDASAVSGVMLARMVSAMLLTISIVVVIFFRNPRE
ncbi:helix-turn-helix domain-containing protein [Secundilactobacillus kimchicus]|uniref:helix-turn-helix domain-containing protein n=1 Tax=Secundilactobacillus kimchicus TaxID=528209 RepID=UPI00070564A2|nr:helix-turn-helix transcriptional regulator [Secundilactobacillus kimchicus]